MEVEMKYLITFMIILAMILTWDYVSADDKIQFNFENTTKVTKIMRLNLMDQPCYVDRFGQKKCYYNRMTAEMRPDDYTAKNDHKVGKNAGDRFCVEWTNLSSNQEKFLAEFCVVIDEDAFEVNVTPEGLEVIPFE
jgi:hypothetical protein